MLAQDQKANRAGLVAERKMQAPELAELKAQGAGLSAQRRVMSAELGPVRYLAPIAGLPADDVLRWFVLLVAVCSTRRRFCSFSWLPGGHNVHS